MKILLIVNNVFYSKKNGLYTFRAIGEFATRLIELNNEVEMLQTVLVKDEEFHDFNLLNTKVKTTPIKRYRIKLFTYLVIYTVGIYKLLKSDFIYIYYPTNYHYLAIVSLIFGKKYGLNVRGQAGVNSPLARFLYKHATVVFTVSPEFTNIVNSVGGRGVTQRPGISFTYDDIGSKPKLKIKSEYTILYLGRLDKEKGLLELLEAVKILLQKDVPKFVLNIVGDGYHQEEILQKANSLNLDNKVNFLGPISNLENIKEVYKNADLFILPTYHEGFPRTLYEAMIFGVPIITTFVGGISSIMKVNYNCLRIEPKSVSSIVDQVEYSLNNYIEFNSILPNAESTIRGILHPDKKSHADELHLILSSIFRFKI